LAAALGRLRQGYTSSPVHPRRAPATCAESHRLGGPSGPRRRAPAAPAQSGRNVRERTRGARPHGRIVALRGGSLIISAGTALRAAWAGRAVESGQSGGERGHDGEPGSGDAGVGLRPADPGLAALLDALPQIVWTCDADGDNEFANRRWMAFTGVESMSQKVRFEAIHPQDRDRALALWRRALATGEPFEADFRLRRHDGTYRWQLARAAPQRDAQGKVVRWIGIATDIEAQFRAVHESAIDGFMVLRSVRDDAGRIVDFVWLYANQAAGRLVGKPRDWFNDRRLLEAFPGNRGAGLFDAYVGVVESGQPWSSEIVYSHDGLDVDVRIAARPADDGVAISFADLSERRRAEQQVRRLQERQAFLLALGDRLRTLTDPHAAMQAAAEMLGRHLRVARCGYAEIDVDGGVLELERGWNDGSMPEAAGRYRLEALGRAMFDELKTGQTLRIDDTLDDPRVERRSAAREVGRGGLRSSIAAPLIKGGRLVALLYVHEARVRHWSDEEAQLVREVAERTWSSSERARAVRALQQSEQRLRLATEGVGLGTWEADLDTGAARWSASNFILFGYEPAPDGHAPPGMFLSRIHPDDLPLVQQELQRLKRGEALYRPEFRIRRADDGEQRWIASFGRLVDDPVSGVRRPRIVGVSLDITDRKRLEAERESLLESERAARSAAESATRAKDEFLATLSHELRTPLSVIISWSRVLERKHANADPELRNALKVISDNAFAQSHLITGLLDMSRIVSGKLTLELRPVDLAEVVADAVDAQAPAAATRGLALRLAGPRTAPGAARVLADPGRLHQVFGNLLSNAIKFTPAGGQVEVQVRSGVTHVEVSVRDTGEGIPADFLPHLFSRFRQADAGAARRHGGLGLGLSVVRQLVEIHGGEVGAHSDGPGRGATFTVRLPVPGADATAAESTAPVAAGAVAEPLGPTSLAGARVLAVEDEPSMREYLARVLEEHGARVVAVSSVDAALQALRGDGPFDLLVSDIGLPGRDGYELIRAVRSSLGLDATRLGAIAVTAFAREEDRRRCLQAGYQRHLSKPYQVAELVAALRQLLPAAVAPAAPP
jgi:PAS domain S-box-containing protein